MNFRLVDLHAELGIQKLRGSQYAYQELTILSLESKRINILYHSIN